MRLCLHLLALLGILPLPHLSACPSMSIHLSLGGHLRRSVRSLSPTPVVNMPPPPLTKEKRSPLLVSSSFPNGPACRFFLCPRRGVVPPPRWSSFIFRGRRRGLLLSLFEGLTPLLLLLLLLPGMKSGDRKKEGPVFLCRSRSTKRTVDRRRSKSDQGSLGEFLSFFFLEEGRLLFAVPIGLSAVV